MTPEQEELDFMREMIIRKYVFKELDVMALTRMLERVIDLSYYNGRLDGEHYMKGRAENEMSSLPSKNSCY